ncbi:flavin reductase [Streptomyces sp. NPDC057580]|uniref:flavin reductase n=1 Tax=Streptomyces sp. NPDC057580 TaxID=3346173 RepID=UPI0036A674CD
MSEETTAPGTAVAEIDPRQFRETLAHYPTGVVVITAMAEGEPVGMVVGSFTSVSLDPPLVAYLPAKTSSSYGRLRRASAFCVNVLAVEQEPLCRRFASRSGDKFDGVPWHLSPTGSPMLADAVAWFDCTVERTVDAGDHDIVLGRVRHLRASGAGSPLLFFQGGYGGFRSRSLVAPFAADLRDQLQVADLARAPMERLAEETGLSCYAQAVVDGDLVIVAGAGVEDGVRTHIGRRMPFLPPYGSLFVDHLDTDTAVDRWTDHLRSTPTPEARTEYARMLGTVRDRGWSLGLRAPRHDEVWHEVARFTSLVPVPAVERRLGELLDGLMRYYEPTALPEDGRYDVRILAAPVRRGGGTALALALYGMPDGADRGTVLGWAGRLRETADKVSALLTSPATG